MKDKVSKIEFYITAEEVDDCILRAAELIKEGYEFYSWKYDPPEFTWNGEKPEPFIHVVLERR